MIIIKDFDNIDKEKLKENLNKIIKLAANEGIELSFGDIVKIPVYLSLFEMSDISNLALNVMMRAVSTGDYRAFKHSERVYRIFDKYEDKLAKLGDRIENNEQI